MSDVIHSEATNPSSNSTKHSTGKSSRKFLLRTALVVPFVLQIIAAVSLVGWLSFRSGQKSVDKLATQLRQEVSDHISQHLNTYLATPLQINQMNLNAYQLGILDLQDFDRLGRYFYHQMKLAKNIGYIDFGSKTGEFVGVGREDKGSLYRELIETPNLGRYTRHALDAQGNPTKVIKTEKYEFQEDDWYANAAKVGKPIWSQIYSWGDRPDILSISSSYPVYDKNHTFIGVIGIDLILSQINSFLNTIKVSPSAKIFILERNGLLVAQSGNDKPYRIVNGKSQRIQASESPNELTRSTTKYLTQSFGNLGAIQSNQLLNFDLKGERQFVQITPWKDTLGLDWLIVVVAPESDFMGEINANTRTTILLCIAALLVTIALGILASRWIARPISRVAQAAKEIAAGDLDQHVEPSRIIEIEQLTDSFNSMAGQIKASFEELERLKDSFARFFPAEYLRFLSKDSVIHVGLGDHISKEMAVMFSDIRSFTTLSESMTPKENFDFVNAYLKRVSPEIRNHNGFIVKFLGDGMMAVFPNGADDAVQAGIEKFKRVQEYNRDREQEGFLPIDVGMGIHIGHMMVGMVGEENRMQGDAFSDNVNLTARLEGLTKFYGVSLLISEMVLQRLNHPEQYQIRFLDRALVKGRTEPIAVYEVLDAEQETIRELKLQTLPDFEQGLKHYYDRELTQAKACFKRMVAVNPLDKTAKLYLERLERLVTEGVPNNWSGVWAFAQK